MHTNDEATEAVGEGYSGELVTVATFPDPAEAHVARTALESAGIPVFLQGENANNLIPVAFTARLQVRPEDEARAREALSGVESTAALDEMTDAALEDDLGEA